MNWTIKKALIQKNAAIFLAMMLLLAGCQPAKPVDIPNIETSSAHSGAVSTASEDAQTQSGASSTEKVPIPEKQPEKTEQAVMLPEELSTSESGYTVELIAPAQYEAHLEQVKDGPRGFPSVEVFFLKQGEHYAVANRNGKFVSDFIYENNEGWASVFGVVNVIKDGKAGLLNAATGEQIIPCEYDSAWVIGDSGFYQVEKGDQIEILDHSGRSVLQLERGDMVCAAEDMLLVQEGGMLKIYNRKDLSLVDHFACDRFFVATQEGQNEETLIAFETTGAWGLAKLDGEVVVEPSYDQIVHFNGDYAVFSQNRKFGLLKYDGTVALKPEWEELLTDVKNPNIARVCRDGKWGAITDIESKKLAIEPIYDFIGEFGEDGCAMFEKNGHYGLLDKQGNEVLPAKYDTPVYSAGTGLKEGYYMLDGDGSNAKGIIGGGKVILTNDHSIWGPQISGMFSDSEPYLIISTQRDKFGYIDRMGKIVIDTRFDKVDGFIADKGVAFVKAGDKICLIDRTGKIVLETVFDDLIGYNPDSMVGAFQYTDEKENSKVCLAKIVLPA